MEVRFRVILMEQNSQNIKGTSCVEAFVESHKRTLRRTKINRKTNKINGGGPEKFIRTRINI